MATATYCRRDPEKTVLYDVVRRNLKTFLAVTDARGGGRGLPKYVRQAFDRYLDCGILQKGFVKITLDPLR